MIPGRQAGAKKAFLGLDAWSFQKWFTSWVMKLQQSPSNCFWGSLPSSAPSKQEKKQIINDGKSKMEFNLRLTQVKEACLGREFQVGPQSICQLSLDSSRHI